MLRGGAICFAFAFAGFAYGGPIAALAVWFAAAGVGIACVETAQHAAVAALAPAEIRGFTSVYSRPRKAERTSSLAPQLAPSGRSCRPARRSSTPWSACSSRSLRSRRSRREANPQGQRRAAADQHAVLPLTFGPTATAARVRRVSFRARPRRPSRTRRVRPPSPLGVAQRPPGDPTGRGRLGGGAKRSNLRLVRPRAPTDAVYVCEQQSSGANRVMA